MTQPTVGESTLYLSAGFKKALVCTVLFSLTGFAVATGCPAVEDSIWESGITGSQSALSSALQTMVQSVSTSASEDQQRIQSALHVLTEQINTSSNNSSQVNLAAKQASANLAVEIDNRKAVMNAIDTYGPATGQGFDPCGENDRSKNVAVAVGEASNDMQDKVTREVDAAPGRFVADPGTVVAQRLQVDKGAYCTADEARAGLCLTAGALAGKDVDAANFFTTSAAGSDLDNAKSAFLNNMLGVPDRALSAKAAQTPAGIAYLEQKRDKDAIASVAAASLKTIQSWNESRSGSGTDTQSVMGALSSKIDTYSGGQNYDTWAQTQASQNERGLLIEYAKMSATQLYVAYLKYQSGEREEAVEAARVALLASNMPSGNAQVINANTRQKVAP
jgi:hypothetical protein